MRKLVILIVTLTLFMSLHPAAKAGENLIINGGFENGNENWQTVNAQLNIIGGALDGSFCGEVVMSKEYGRAMNKVRFQKGVKYIVSIYVKLKEGRNTASLIADHRSFGDKQLIKAVIKDVRVSDKWTKLTGAYEWNGEGTGEAYIYVRIGDATLPVTFYMDSMSVMAYKEPPKEYRTTVPNAGELALNTGFEETTEPFIASNSYLTLIEGDGAEDTASCALVSVTDKDSYIGQAVKLSPNSRYCLSAYIKNIKGAPDFEFAVELKNKEGHDAGRYIIDYAAEADILADVKKIHADEIKNGEWKLISAYYDYFGESENEAYVYLHPFAYSGTEYMLDKFSVVKTGEIKADNENNTSLKGFFVNNIPVFPKGGYQLYNNTAMLRAEELADIIGAGFSFELPVCSIKKGLNTVKVNTDTGIAYLNNRLIPMQKAYIKDGAVMVDVCAVCRVFGAEAYITSDGSVRLTIGTQRAGLNGTASRLDKDKYAVVAFTGGAVAYGSGAGIRNETSYRSLVMNHLRNRYNDCSFKEINRSLGKVNSGLDIYRTSELMEENPDLVFIDFVPEDYSRNSSEVEKTLESLICGIRKAKADTDIVFLQSYIPAFEKDYGNGKIPEIIKVYNSVAERYKIPIVNMGLKMYDISGGKTSDYLLYSYYPNDAGHKLYADTICGFIDDSLSMCSSTRQIKDKEISGITSGSIVSAAAAELNGFERISGSLIGNVGDELVFEFEGTEVGLLWNIGLDSGAAEYEIDGYKYDTIIAFDENGVRSKHINYAMLARGLKNTRHMLRLVVSDEKASMSLGNRIEICGFLVGICE